MRLVVGEDSVLFREGLVRLLETSFDVSTRRTGERISLQKKRP